MLNCLQVDPLPFPPLSCTHPFLSSVLPSHFPFVHLQFLPSFPSPLLLLLLSFPFSFYPFPFSLFLSFSPLVLHYASFSSSYQIFSLFLFFLHFSHYLPFFHPLFFHLSIMPSFVILPTYIEAHFLPLPSSRLLLITFSLFSFLVSSSSSSSYVVVFLTVYFSHSSTLFRSFHCYLFRISFRLLVLVCLYSFISYLHFCSPFIPFPLFTCSF